MKKLNITIIGIVLLFIIKSNAQSMEVTGQMKVKQMPTDNAAQELVVKQADGTLAKRSVASLISGSTAVDSVQSFQRDMDLLQTLCECRDKNIPPFMIKRLMAHGYTENDLLGAGIPKRSIDAAKPVLDGDGNEYGTITIGEQTWLLENLRTTTYNDGTPIQFANSASAWSSATGAGQPVYCWPQDNPANAVGYGGLYNYFVTGNNNQKRVCPLGFKVASNVDFIILYQTLTTLSNTFANNSSSNPIIAYSEINLGLAVKDTDPTYWLSPNEASNVSGLSIPGAGLRTNDGTFESFREKAFFFATNLAFSVTATSNIDVMQLENTLAYFRLLSSSTMPDIPAGNGVSVRCVKTY